MFTPHLKGKVAVALAGVVTAGSLAAPFLFTSAPAGADPKQMDALIGFGSDTTQDVVNALSGHASGVNYTPVQGGTAKQQLISYDAKNPAGSDVCVAPKPKSVTMYRPNGSSEGRRALSRAVDLSGYGPTTSCGGTKNIQGLVDFARSSDGPASGDSGTDLTYIPFGRDGVSFAYYSATIPAADMVTTLTKAQLVDLYTNGPKLIDPDGAGPKAPVEVVPCGIQSGSGTFKFWTEKVLNAASTEDAATATCRNATTTPTGDGRLQENDGNGLKSKGDALPTKQVIIGFSAANFISQRNGVVTSQLPSSGPAVDLGAIADDGAGNNLGLPYSGSGSTLTPVTTFYNNGTFGRAVYNVLSTARLQAPGSLGLKALFVTDTGQGFPGVVAGSTAELCKTTTQENIVNKFGFTTPGNCGSTDTKGTFISGIK